MNWEFSEMNTILKLRMAQFPLTQAVKTITAAAVPSASMGTKKKEKPAPKPAKAPKPKPQKQEQKRWIDETPPGEKKDLSRGMPETYDPKYVESAWYPWWEKKKFFHSETKNALAVREESKGEKKQFTIIIPPPNITGALHLGHALMLSIEDTVVRWKRMAGYECCWLPGQDHAGISTQTVVENMLWRDKRQTRHDLGRPKFVETAMEWKELYGGKINHQFKKMGISVDWDRFVFTMDEKRCRAVEEAFIQMFNKGIIYRASRLVNWCSALQTALSDLEVEYKDLEKPTDLSIPNHQKRAYTFGEFTHFYYEVEGCEEKLEIATTRLETMLGDVAVAVHPEDERYKHLIGRNALHPIHKDRKLPIIADPILVKMDVGTGVVKVTPAHDHNDFACGERHKLPQINVFNDNGTINHNGGPYEKMPRFDARSKLYKDLEKLGLIKGKVKNPMRIGVCAKTGDIIEPMIKPQWYVDCKDLANRSIEKVKNKELKIIPPIYEKTWYDWLENIRDWCISRQLWWGHRIPAYYVTVKGKQPADPNLTENWVVGRSIEEAKATAAQKLKVDQDLIEIKQDQDVLDTWFSSGLFPFSSFGWPDLESKDLAGYFPGDLLETGHDILFFWVARMVMMSLFFLNKLPFHTVYLHPMVRDQEGKKMSKTRGNVIDPIQVIEGCPLETLLNKLRNSNLAQKEIARAEKLKAQEFPDGIQECGTDALRLGLLTYIQAGKSINLNIKRVIGYRHFCNKLWNMCIFMQKNLQSEGIFNPPRIQNVKQLKLSVSDRWILHRLYSAAQRSNAALEAYNFGECATLLYDFFLKEICDVYLETLKPVFGGDQGDVKDAARATLFWVIEKGLILMHPLMPFITEELYQRMPLDASLRAESLCIAQYPTGPSLDFFKDQDAEKQMGLINEIATNSRSVVSQLDIKKTEKPKAFLYMKSKEAIDQVTGQLALISVLGRLGEVTLLESEDARPAGCVMTMIRKEHRLFIEIKGLVDITKEVERIGKKIFQSEKQIDGLKKKMSNPSYEEKVPDDVKLENQTKLALLEEEHAKMQESIEELGKI